MILSALFTGFAARILVPRKIDRKTAWFKGCCSMFLEQFPSTR